MSTAIRAALVAALLATTPAPSVHAEEGSDPYHGGERPQDLVVWVTGAGEVGAGVIFDYDGQYAWIMTALHVVRPQGRYLDDLRVELRVWPGRVLQVDPDSFLGRPTLDFAAFRVDLGPLGIPSSQIEKTLPLDLLGSSKGLRRGDRVFTVGHTFNQQWVIPNRPIFFHSFKTVDPDSGTQEIAQVEYQCPPGHSGGALFDERWRLVGVILDTEGPFCWALRVDEALKVLRQLQLSVGLHQRTVEDESAGSILPSEINVPVVDFDNRSGTHLPDLGPVAHDLVSSFLVSLPRDTP